MTILYKQKCIRCRKNYVIISRMQRSPPFCYECQKKDLKKNIKDPKMKKFFNIPEELYKVSAFLRNIKICYLKYGDLTENQRNAFIKVTNELKQKPL